MYIDSQGLEPAATLSQTKKGLLDKFLRGQVATVSDAPIVKRPGNFAPLSPAQLRLWYLYKLDPNSVGYNYTTALRLTGKLDFQVLQECIHEIIRRHEILRSTFAEVDGQPNLLITPELYLALQLHDLSHLPKAQRQAELLRVIKEVGNKAFNLSTGPLLRVDVLCLGQIENEEVFTLVFSVHHIAFDGWSASILLKEFVTLYNAFASAQTSPLPELPIQYADFAYWQHHYLQGKRLEQQRLYWKKQLKGIPALLELPTDRLRSAVRSYHGASHFFSIEPELTDKLYKIARVHECTLFTLLLSAFNTLLHRYSGEKDICVGIPFAGRMKPELEDLIGFFINTLVIRTKFDNDSDFITLVKSTQTVVLDAQANQDVPFDKLVEELKPPRNQGYNPLFQVMFVLHNLPSSSVDLPGLKLETIEVDYEVSKFDLVLHATEKEVLELAFEYSTELFDAERIARLANYFQLILEVLTSNLNTRVNDFALLTRQEQEEILQWNATERTFPQPRFLHSWFENQAQQHPQAIAVSCSQQTLSYSELDRRANQLAHWLRAQGVAPEVRVGICLERSMAMVVGILGILKAGGAYVPINSTNPKERISSLLADCGTPIVLTQERLLTGLPSHLNVFCLDRDWGQLSTLPAHPASFQQHSATAAYVIYTSGSTGSPKGVVVSHKNALASTWARFDYYQQPLDGFLLASPIAFDSSVAGLFWTLSLGGRLCIPTEAELQDMDALTSLIAREKLSHLLCLPSFYSLILDYINRQPLNKLRTVIVAGEACLPELVAKHYARAADIQLYNEYGPTEATVWSSVYAIQHTDSVSNPPLAVGQPIANSQIYLLDHYFNPVPIGVPGELYIGGAGLTRGYLGRPDLTAERFVPNPFSTVSGNRLYKTGDLARYRSDGNIEFLGRSDHQVKIRGFRIELGEIEAQLLRYPGVSEALAVAREERGNAKYLAAYWVAAAQFEADTFDIKQLQDFLKKHLPDYMMPSVFVQLQRLPRTVTGKIDRSALPLPDWNEQLDDEALPRSATEKQLAHIWAELLQLERIGIHDNFFSLGGDSILVMQMVNRARQSGLYLNPQQLSQHQTIAKLTAVIAEAVPRATETRPVTGLVPLTPIQHWFFDQCLVNPHHWNQALMLEARIAVDSCRLKQAVEYLLTYHDALRLRFTLDADGWQQHYGEERMQPVFHQVDLSGIDDTLLSLEIEKQAGLWQKQLNITEGYLMQVVLFNTGKNRPARLLIVIHHLAVDGVSWRILLDDLHTLYRQLTANQTLSLPPKTTSYQQWAQHLQEWAQSSSMLEESAYWLNLLAEQPRLPVDNPNGRSIEAMSAILTDSLSVDSTKKLLDYASSTTGSAINEILLAALAKTLSVWSQSLNILIDVDLHGRVDMFSNLDLSRSVGWFTSVFPVLICLPDDLDNKNILSTVKNQLLKIPNKGIGYGVLQHLRDLSIVSKESPGQYRSPVLFNYLGQLDQAFSKSSAFCLAKESVGSCIDPLADIYNELSVDAHILEGRLHITWRYSAERYKASTIQELISRYHQSIIELTDKN